MNKTEYKVTVFENGRQEWRNDKGEWHRLDGPAYIDGDFQSWWVDGKRHRLDGPAVIDGKCQQWWVNGSLHRLDGPAWIDGDYQAWWVDDERHRLDGPALIEGDEQEWYINGKEYSKDEFDSYIAKMNQPQVIPKIKTIELDGKLYEIKLLEGQ